MKMKMKGRKGRGAERRGGEGGERRGEEGAERRQGHSERIAS